jgi:hypothetical protein
MRRKDDNTGKNVSVRVELKPGALGKLVKYGFQNKNIPIPPNTCPPNLYRGSPYCDTFYDVYCENVNTVFMEHFPRQIDDNTNQYIDYAPECACYAPDTIGQENVPSGIPPACYKNTCTVENTASYPDPLSRSQPCNATFCSSVINASELNVEKGNLSINPTVVQECGSSSITSSTGSEKKGQAPVVVNYTLITLIVLGICFCLISLICSYSLFFKKKSRKL